MKIINLLKKIGNLLKKSLSEFINDNAMKHSAALSYYTIFSLPPLLIIIISLCGLFFGAEAVRGEVFGQINGLVGNESAYLGSSAIATWYGATGSIILILVWVYYSAIILYFGAEFTKVYAHTHGQKIIPNEYSVSVIKSDIEIEAGKITPTP